MPIPAKKKAEPERRKIELPEEPAPGSADAARVVFRMPLSGERVERHFLRSDKVQLLYDFVDHLQNEDKCKFEGVEHYTDKYRLVQPMPRKNYEDKHATIEEAGLFPRGAMLQIQQIEDEEDED